MRSTPLTTTWKPVSSPLDPTAWRPITDPPDDEMLVLVTHPDWDDPTWVGYRDGGEWRWACGLTCDPQPLGWQPLPEPMTREGV